MRTLAKVLAIVVALTVSGAALQAQRAVRPLRPMLRRAMTDPVRRQAMRQRLQSLTPEQRTAIRQRMQAARAERQRLAQGLRSGQLTRAQARAQLREWRKTNPQRSPRPVRPFMQ